MTTFSPTRTSSASLATTTSPDRLVSDEIAVSRTRGRVDPAGTKMGFGFETGTFTLDRFASFALVESLSAWHAAKAAAETRTRTTLRRLMASSSGFRMKADRLNLE
jgi:hypothetical protein